MCANRQAPDAPPKVLLVEDEPAVAKILRISLRASGFDVVDAATGGDALELLEHEPADAVILDLGLPDGRGREVLDRLRRAHDDGFRAWMVISALDREEAARRYGPLGGHYVTKPFDPWDLARMLQTLLSEKERPRVSAGRVLNDGGGKP
jgi:two-component system KDP operon response regulator KdpE